LNEQISDAIDDINELGATIKQLNIDIMKVEAGGVDPTAEEEGE
jgi:flagellar hook-associated protein FlgK